MRAMVPSSFIISQITPAPFTLAIRARSTEPSVWPGRLKTPPFLARNGKICPGRAKSLGRAPSATAAKIVVARSAAEMPVVTPSLASIDSRKAVPILDVLFATCGRKSNWSHKSPSSVRQISPPPSLRIKLMPSAVICSAAITRSPSFSRRGSSTRMIILPAAIASIACFTVAKVMFRVSSTLFYRILNK